mmetsp:Transcript_91147/g.217419  ORF Transcript_91147/g.217419 Transcript_91147/m.217419 type:complete len:200 (+) Transcript_91147:2557-3156(+)
MAASQAARCSAVASERPRSAAPSRSAWPSAVAPEASVRRRRMAAFCFASSSSKVAMRRAASCKAALRASPSSSTRRLALPPAMSPPVASSTSPSASLRPLPASPVTTFADSRASFSALAMSFDIAAQAAPNSVQASFVSPSADSANASHCAQASACSFASFFRVCSSARVLHASRGSTWSGVAPFCKAFLRFFICDRCF